MDAEREVVVGEALALGARFIGVMLEPFAGEAQARALALDTNSLDAEGAPLVYSWDQADPEGLREIILAAIQHLAGGLRFESAGIVVVPRAGSVEAEIIASEPHGVGPLLAHELPEALTFELTLALPARAAVDQLVLIDLRLVADNAVEMGQQTWIVRVPQF